MTPSPPVEEQKESPGSLSGCLAESMRELDDAEVVKLRTHPVCGAAARAEIASRKRFEAGWLGTWSSGEDAPPRKEGPIPQRWNRPKKKPTLSGKLASRKEVRDLWYQVKNGNKVQKEAAKHILRTKFGQSVF